MLISDTFHASHILPLTPITQQCISWTIIDTHHYHWYSYQWGNLHVYSFCYTLPLRLPSYSQMPLASTFFRLCSNLDNTQHKLMQCHDNDKETSVLCHIQYPRMLEGRIALAVVYHEDPEVLLEEHFQLLKNFPYIHQ